jgi:hypothetical protein
MEQEYAILTIVGALVVFAILWRTVSSESSTSGPIVGPSTGGVDTEVTDAFQFAGKRGAVVTGWVLEDDVINVKVNGATVAAGSGVDTTSVVGNGVTYYRAALKRQMEETYVYGVSYSTGSSESSYTAEELEALTKAELITIGNTIGVQPELRPSWTKARMIEAILNH